MCSQLVAGTRTRRCGLLLAMFVLFLGVQTLVGLPPVLVRLGLVSSSSGEVMGTVTDLVCFLHPELLMNVL